MKKKTFHIITIGCQMNKSDSERMAGYLENFGYQSVPESTQADLVLITTCGIRQSAENRLYGLVSAIKQQNPAVRLIVTGCLSERADVQDKLRQEVDIWLPIRDLAELGARLGHETQILPEYADDYLKFSPSRNSSFSAFVPIGNGCNNYCSYCVVPYARGPEKYRPSAEIVAEVTKLVADGYKEITLIAQNVNSYVSGAQDFPALLRLVDAIEGDFWLRFATSHPRDMSEALIAAFSDCAKLCPHLHLPAQSGDNEILRSMNRGYSVETYRAWLDRARTQVPGISLTTDLIVGFPGETEAQFQNTLALVESVGYDVIFVSQFSPRPGTAASQLLDDVLPAEKQHREQVLLAAWEKGIIEHNQSYLHKTFPVLVEGRNKKGLWYGKTASGKVIRIREGAADLVGVFATVRIVEVARLGLYGEVQNL